jgi:hypothetical protein
VATPKFQIRQKFPPTLLHNEPQISEGTNSVGIVRGIWAFAYVLLCAVFLLKNLT